MRGSLEKGVSELMFEFERVLMGKQRIALNGAVMRSKRVTPCFDTIMPGMCSNSLRSEMGKSGRINTEVSRCKSRAKTCVKRKVARFSNNKCKAVFRIPVLRHKILLTADKKYDTITRLKG